MRTRPPNPQPKISAGVVIIRFEKRQALFLVLRAYRNWDFPKGLVEPQEDALSAARREATEETGIMRLDFKWGHDHIDTTPYSGGKIARFFVAESQEEEVRLSWEHHEFRWLPYMEARALLHPRLQAVLDWALGLAQGRTAG